MGLSVAARHASTTRAEVSGSFPKATPPSLTLGQEILISIASIAELLNILVTAAYSSIVDPETFATKAYSYAAQDLLEAAAFPSLCLIIWASIFILFISKYILSEK